MGFVKHRTEENKTKGNLSKIFCAECNRPTNHCVIVSADRIGSEDIEDDISIDWADNYQVVQCQGCDTFSFRHLSWFSENEDPYGGSDGTTERVYPKRDATTLKIPDFFNVPPTLRRIHRETIEAFNSDCLTLCAAGLRGLVEGICADQAVTDGPVTVPAKGGGTQVVRKDNLEGKIAGLSEKGILTKPVAETLQGHRYLGNEAVHELAQPSSDELKLAIEIIEHTLEQLHEIPEKATALKERIARRKAKK